MQTLTCSSIISGLRENLCVLILNNVIYHQAVHPTKWSTFRQHRNFAIQLLYHNRRKPIRTCMTILARTLFGFSTGSYILSGFSTIPTAPQSCCFFFCLFFFFCFFLLFLCFF